jgi:predicted outer membrane repeat protein
MTSILRFLFERRVAVEMSQTTSAKGNSVAVFGGGIYSGRLDWREYFEI